MFFFTKQKLEHVAQKYGVSEVKWRDTPAAASTVPRRVALPTPGGERWAQEVGARLEARGPPGAMKSQSEIYQKKLDPLWGVCPGWVVATGLKKSDENYPYISFAVDINLTNIILLTNWQTL